MDNNEELEAGIKVLDNEDIALKCLIRKTKKKLVKTRKIARKAPKTLEQMEATFKKIVDEQEQRIVAAEKRGEQKIKKQISERNSKNARKKADNPEKIEARNKIFEMARKIRETSKTKLTINAIAEKISNEILQKGNKKGYGITAENPKNTIYYWLKKYPDWEQ